MEAAVAELERQAALPQPDTPYLDLDDRKAALIDGRVDLERLVAAIEAATPAPTDYNFDDLPQRDGRHAPKDGTLIATLQTMRWTVYKPNSEMVRRFGPTAGRWQKANGFGGWENCETPERFLPHPQIQRGTDD